MVVKLTQKQADYLETFGNFEDEIKQKNERFVTLLVLVMDTIG
nr:hypothetical protein [Streptococcus uberis]